VDETDDGDGGPGQVEEPVSRGTVIEGREGLREADAERIIDSVMAGMSDELLREQVPSSLYESLRVRANSRQAREG
jgi:hypothetical protein